MIQASKRPAQWRRVHVADVCEMVSVGIVIQPSQYYVEASKGVRAFRSANVGENRIVDRDWVYLSPEGHQVNSKSSLRAGDVLVVRSGAPGTACVVTEQYAGSNCIDIVFARPRQDQVLPEYLAEFTNSPVGKRHVLGMQGGLALQHFNVGAYKQLELLLPDVAEQKRIVDVFAAWDTAIQKTEQLIAARERTSKALMQRVFRAGSYPRRRLSEFTRRVTRKNVEGDGHPLTISGAEGLVSQSRYFGKRIAAEKTEHYTLLKRGEYAYNKSYSAGYPLGAIKRLDAHDEGIVSTLYLCFALDDSKAPISDYFAYFCEAGGFNHQIYQVAQEGARNHGLLNVTAEDFFSMNMPVPPYDVQERVAKVLGAAMQELTLLRKQLAALRTQKRGLMQKLLTGQWRLGPPKEVSA
jgi:type I restriction enzyme, S subunit